MWIPCTTKTQRVSRIRELLDANDHAVLRGIVAIYRFQTETEQAYDQTKMTNGVGFSAFDAPFMSSLAKAILAGTALSPRQLAIGRNKIKRYANQLAAIAEKREQEHA